MNVSDSTNSLIRTIVEPVELLGRQLAESHVAQLERFDTRDSICIL